MTHSTSHHSAILSLISGYKQFKKKYFERGNTFGKLVKEGQQPKVLVIACCDSRVDPVLLTNSGPGELFVVRNIANLVPHYEKDSHHLSISSALEYGVLTLNISDIIVLGHSHCGGIRALMQDNNGSSSSFIKTWLDSAKTTKRHVLNKYSHCSFDEQVRILEKESLLTSIENLKTFPFIHKCLVENKLSLHAWYFNLETGDIESYHPSTKHFIKLV